MAITSEAIELGSRGRLQGTRWGMVILSIPAGLGIALSVVYSYGIVFGTAYMPEVGFMYLIMALFLPLAFLNYPMSAKYARKIPWFDWAMAGLTFGILLYGFFNWRAITWLGWGTSAPPVALVLAAIIIPLVWEAGRRTSGWLLTFVVIFFTIFPLFANHMPGFLKGYPASLRTTISAHVYGGEGLLGLPMRIVGTYVVAFMVFSMTLLQSGGAKFLINLALSLFGRMKGGTAKATVGASAMYSMISGSAMANVIATGSVTIPAMIRSGIEPNMAGAIESTASTGGAITPPVMGAAAFLMATFLQVPYGVIVIAAAVPAILYFIAVYVQVDLYSRRVGLATMTKEQTPRFWSVVMNGWTFVLAMAVFTYLLVLARIEVKAAFYTGLLMIALYPFRGGENILDRIKQYPAFLKRLLPMGGNLLGQIIPLFAVIGLITGGITMTGTGMSMGGEIVKMAGGNAFVLLLLASVCAFILGLALTTTAVYVLVALLIAPALVQAGINPIAAHLFALWHGTLGSLTPPVATAPMVASKIAGGEFFRTSIIACRIGIGLFLLPFFFALSPALVAQGPVAETAFRFVMTAIGIIIMSSAFEGYLYRLGRLNAGCRLLLFAGGMLLAIPVTSLYIWGALITAAGVFAAVAARKRALAAEAVPR